LEKNWGKLFEKSFPQTPFKNFSNALRKEVCITPNSCHPFMAPGEHIYTVICRNRIPQRQGIVSLRLRVRPAMLLKSFPNVLAGNPESLSLGAIVFVVLFDTERNNQFRDIC
jgi:hypothetical protein